jgi:hypothetical protein
MGCLAEEKATVRAWMPVHFSLVAYRSRFYNILTSEFSSCVCILVTSSNPHSKSRDILSTADR